MRVPLWAYYLMGGIGILVAVDGLLGVGWPWTLAGGVLLFLAALYLFQNDPRVRTGGEQGRSSGDGR